MANPARKFEPIDNDPRLLDPTAPIGLDPLAPPAANTAYPRVDNRTFVESRGSGVLIAAIIVVLAIAAYFMFAPGRSYGPAATDQPAITETAPDATAPAAPAPDAAAPAPDASAPAAPAPDAAAPAAPETPAAPAPESSAPAAPAPAAPAPAQ